MMTEPFLISWWLFLYIKTRAVFNYASNVIPQGIGFGSQRPVIGLGNPRHPCCQSHAKLKLITTSPLAGVFPRLTQFTCVYCDFLQLSFILKIFFWLAPVISLVSFVNTQWKSARKEELFNTSYFQHPFRRVHWSQTYITMKGQFCILYIFKVNHVLHTRKRNKNFSI